MALAVAPPASAAAPCQFVLGFRTLHDLIPGVVGDCKANEYHNPDNGDGLQLTTGGLLVWRKADNWTAFTDGYRTWILGPQGLQQRLNTERFPWERDPASTSAPSSAPCAATAQTVIPEASQREADGSITWRGSIRNPCGRAATFVVDVRSLRSQDGPPFVDAPTILVQDLAPGASQPISTRVPAAGSTGWIAWEAGAIDDAALGCLGRAGTGCITADPVVGSAIRPLLGSDEGTWLLRVAGEHGIHVVRQRTPSGVLGIYRHETGTIVLDQRLDSYSSWVRAAVLAHELQHAADDAAGLWPTSSAQCYRAEEVAFRREASVWARLWRSQLPPNVDALHAELNAITLAVSRDPVSFAAALAPAYRRECGG
jgi:hypothetical protein